MLQEQQLLTTLGLGGWNGGVVCVRSTRLSNAYCCNQTEIADQNVIEGLPVELRVSRASRVSEFGVRRM